MAEQNDRSDQESDHENAAAGTVCPKAVTKGNGRGRAGEPCIPQVLHDLPGDL